MLKNILNKSFERRYKCLTFSVHERYQFGLKDVNCDFYMLNFPNEDEYKGVWKPWNVKFGPLPNNHVFLDDRQNVVSQAMSEQFDFILSQNKFGNYQIAKKLQQYTHLPILQLEHTLPPRGLWDEDRIAQCKTMRGDLNVFISEYSKKEWEWEDRGDTVAIGHCVDTELFNNFDEERDNVIMTVANDYIGRDFFLNFKQYKKVTEGLPTKAFGDTPGFSKPADSVEHLVKEYNKSRIFLNTAHISPIPTVMLEAAACGCAIVSCKTCAIPEYFTHNENILFAESDDEMRHYLELLMKDEVLAKKLGENARRRMIEHCNTDKFTNAWNYVIDETANMFYKGVS